MRKLFPTLNQQDLDVTNITVTECDAGDLNLDAASLRKHPYENPSQKNK